MSKFLMLASLLLLGMSCSDADLLQGRRGNNPGGGGGGGGIPAQRNVTEVAKEMEDALKKPIGGQTFAQTNCLSKEILAVMDTNVEAQNTEWGCGKVSSHLAVAAAQWALNQKVNRLALWSCSLPGDYPLAVSMALSQIKAIAPKVADIILNQFPQIDAPKPGEETYIRVGALPTGIKEYVDKKLQGTGKQSTLVAVSTLNLAQLKAHIVAGVNKGMPSIFLHRATPEADSLYLHYAVAVGLDTTNSHILYMDTSPQGAGRLKSMEANTLLDRMNMSGVKARLTNLMTSKLDALPGVTAADIPPEFAGKTVSEALTVFKSGLKKGARVPDMTHINAIENYNLITF